MKVIKKKSNYRLGASYVVTVSRALSFFNASQRRDH